MIETIVINLSGQGLNETSFGPLVKAMTTHN